MYKDLLEQLNSIPSQYDEGYRQDKEREMASYKDDILKAEILEDIVKNKYIKDLISSKIQKIEDIDNEILTLSTDLSPTNIRKIQSLQGQRDATQQIIKDLTPPDISHIKKVIEEELKYIKNNGQ